MTGNGLLEIPGLDTENRGASLIGLFYLGKAPLLISKQVPLIYSGQPVANQ